MSIDMALEELESKQIKELESKTTTAIGLLGLKDALDVLVKKENPSTGFQGSDHYIMYELNRQQSLIKVDMRQPIQVLYCDLALRPAPPNVRDVIYSFLVENGGSKDQFTDMYFQKERQIKLTASINGETLPLPADPKVYAYDLLSRTTREKLANPQVSRMGMFSNKGTKGDGIQQEVKADKQQLPKPRG